MRFEHVALNVSEPVAMAEWYEEHLDAAILRSMDEPPYTHFVADSGGRIFLEIYNNPPKAVPNYGSMDPLILHLAFDCPDPESHKDRLIAAGASLVRDELLEDGSLIVTLRDPWGLPIQLCRRGKPFEE